MAEEVNRWPGPTPSHPLGLDVGGANLKAADSRGNAWSESFPLWRAPGELAGRLAAIVARFPQTDALAATMTGELADCFATKTEGVAAITQALREAAGDRRLALWSIPDGFVTPEQALRNPMRVAAGNWHALASWVGTLLPSGWGLLLDIGSTTSDLIPIYDGFPRTAGHTDLNRQLAGELVYTGVRRTPVCAIPGRVELRGGAIAPAAELFATTLDVHLLRGEIAEDPGCRETANGGPATRAGALDRLARSFCCDVEELTMDEICSAASQLAQAQRNQLLQALSQIQARCNPTFSTVVVSGSGGFLAAQIAQEHPATCAAVQIPLADRLSPAVSESAAAHAVARLAWSGLAD